MIIYLIKCIAIMVLLLSPSLYIGFKKNISIGKLIPTVFLSEILIIYIGGLLKLLKPTSIVLILLSLIFFILFIYDCIKKKRNIKDIFSPVVVIYLLFALFLMLFHYGRLLSEWDEFSHWGDVVKAMFTINDFSTNPNSLSYFQSYLPGVSIFLYYVQIIFGSFNESLLYFDYELLAFSLFLPFISDAKWENKNKIIVFILISFLLPLIFNYAYYSSIYVDSFLGFIFGYLLFQIYTIKKYDLFNVYNLVVTSSVLILVKDIAIVFIGIYALIVIYEWLKRKETAEIDLKKTLILIITPIIIFLLWKINVSINHANIVFDNPVDIKELISIFLRNDTTYKATVLNNFLLALNTRPIINSTFQVNFYTLLTISILYFYLFHKSENNSRSKFFGFIIIFGSLLYTGANLVAYLTKFSEYESLKLASFERYIAIYFISIFVFIAFYIISNFKKSNQNLIIIFLIVLGFTSNISNIPSSFYNVPNTIKQRSYYLTSKNIISKELGDKKAKIYFIAEGTNGFDYWQFKFVNRDNLSGISDVGTFTIGYTKESEDDIFTYKITKEEWLKKLVEEFDYVYLYKIDGKFITNYGSLFEDEEDIGNDKLYKVDKNIQKLTLVGG